MHNAIHKQMFAATLMAAISATAVAADGPTFTWDGFHLGGHIGTGRSKHDIEVDPASPNVQHTATGSFWGIQGGYRRQIDRMVFGIEADYSPASIEANDTVVVDFPEYGGGRSTANNREKLDSIFTILGKFGYTFENVLPYVAVGYGQARSKPEGTLTLSGFPTLPDSTIYSADHSNTHKGAILGVGVDTRISKKVSIFAEYRYWFLSRENGVPFPTIDTTPRGIQVDLQTLRVGLNYFF